MSQHLIDPPSNQLAQRLIGEGFVAVAKLTASNMEAYLFRKQSIQDGYSPTEEKIVLIRYGIAELFKEM